MSIYSSIHILPVNGDWMPTLEQLEGIVKYIHTDNIWSASCYKKPLEWKKREIKPSFDYYDLSIEDALSIVLNTKCALCILRLDCKDFSEIVSSEANSISDDIRGDFRPWDVVIYYGSFTIPLWDNISTLGSYHFQIKISGYGIPLSNDDYIAAVSRLISISNIFDYSLSILDQRMTVELSSSY